MDFFSDLAPYLDPRVLLADNQFAQGALLAGLLTWLGYQFRAVPGKVLMLLRRRFVVTVEIRDPEVFRWFAHWLSEQDYVGDRCRRVAAERAPRPELMEEDDAPPPLQFSPSRGLHIFRVNGWPFWLSRDKEDVPMAKDSGYTVAVEYFTLNTLGSKPDRAKAVLEEAYALYARASRDVAVYFHAWGWTKAKEAAPRPLESVVLSDEIKDDLVGDLRRFYASRERYADLGIPYRRGYLLEGPPGSGKSSIVRALATEFRRSLYVANPKSFASDNAFIDALNAIPSGSIVLFEDVDAAGVEREGEQKGLTFSGFLNGLDGVASQEGIVYFFTTNVPEGLDDALLRPGRIDRRYHIGHATGEQAARLFARFYPEASGDLPRDLGPVSMAEIQGVFQRHEDDPEGALEALWGLVRARKHPLAA